MTEQQPFSAFDVNETLAHFAAAQASIYRASDPLTDAMAELNRASGTETDAGMARALRLILARKGLVIVEAGRG